MQLTGLVAVTINRMNFIFYFTRTTDIINIRYVDIAAMDWVLECEGALATCR